MDNSKYLKEMGARIRAARNARKIPLTALSSSTGIGITALSFLENGKSNPHLLTLKAVADVLNVDVKEFL